MRNLFNTAALVAFLLGIYTLSYELVTDVRFDMSLWNHNKGLPPGSETLKIAKNDDSFIPSQEKALHKKIDRISVELLKYCCIGFSTLLFLSLFIRKVVQEMIGRMVSIVPRYNGNVRYKEINFVSLVLTLLVISMFGTSLVGLLVSMFGASLAKLFLPYLRGYVPSVILYAFTYLAIFPVSYLMLSKLLKMYGSRFVVACYLAYFVKAITEFVTLDDVDLETMKPVDISEFSSDVKDYLRERNLDRRVYTERKKSESLNAALVGWGRFERIEIYGEHNHLSDREFEAVLMHEIGHSQDFSLIKKLSVLFMLKLAEMGIVLTLYSKVSEKYSDEVITQSGSFILLYMIYLMLMSRWLMMFHRLTSQTAERAADTIAKSRKYGKDLARVLYNITVRGESSIDTTWLYNSVKSYHPTVYDRIEYLSK